jgi:hypothetical protein
MDYLKIYEGIFNEYENYDNHIGYIDRYNYIIKEISKYSYKKIIDISSGRGVLIKLLQNKFSDIKICTTDIKKFNDIDVDFIKLDLTNKIEYNNIIDKYDLLLCLDVLEHIEEEYIDDVLNFLSSISENFCFSIANHSDIKNNYELHLIQKNKKWWNTKLKKYYKIIKTFNKYDNKLYCYILTKKNKL